MDNIVEKGEIAHFEQFHLFPQGFPKAFFFNVLKWVHMEDRVNFQAWIKNTHYKIHKLQMSNSSLSC